MCDCSLPCRQRAAPRCPRFTHNLGGAQRQNRLLSGPQQCLSPASSLRCGRRASLEFRVSLHAVDLQILPSEPWQLSNYRPLSLEQRLNLDRGIDEIYKKAARKTCKSSKQRYRIEGHAAWTILWYSLQITGTPIAASHDYSRVH